MSRKICCALAAGWVCLSGAFVLAQVSPAKPAASSTEVMHNPEAVAILQKAIAQYQPALATIVDSSAQGSCSQDSAPAIPFIWITAGSSYRYQNLYGSDASVLVKGSHGTFKQISSTTSSTPLSRNFGTAIFPVYNPFLFIEAILVDPAVAVTSPQNVSAEGRQAVRIRVAYGRDATLGAPPPLLLYFDRSQGDLLGIDLRRPDETKPNASAPVHVEYGAPTLQNGIPGPSSLTFTDAAGVATLCTVTSWSFNTSPSASTFLPGDAQ